MLTRRLAMVETAAMCALPALGGSDPLAELEAKSGGRLGVAVLDTGSGRTLRHRAEERFAMCSTFKLMLAAAVYARIDAGKENANRLIAYGKADLVAWSPDTGKHAGEGMTIAALMDAILLYSDNTAANLLLNTIGGPPGWTAFARALGDTTSRLDRIETALNSAVPGDERDTSTPAAMLADLQKVLQGDVLSPASRAALIETMARGTLGATRLKAGLPAGWRVADKTGSGDNGTRNDIGMIMPPDRKPILAVAYFTGSPLSDPERFAVLAEVGRLIAGL